MKEGSVRSRIFGFIASLILTLGAFIVIVQPEFFHFSAKAAVFVIFILGVIQFIVQCVCFLNIWSEKGPRWNLFVFFSTLSIILIIVLFSIWIMGHLDIHMMTM